MVADLLHHVNEELNGAYDAIQTFSDPNKNVDPTTMKSGADFSSLSILWGDDNTFETDSLLFRAVTKMEALRKAKADLQMVCFLLSPQPPKTDVQCCFIFRFNRCWRTNIKVASSIVIVVCEGNFPS